MKVVYVTGAGHIGSTIFDIVLGNHPRIQGVGEVSKVHRSGWVRNSNRRCACGSPIPECSFWPQVRRSWASKVGDDDVARYVHLQERFERLRSEGITFIGPSAAVIRGMGDKITSRRTAAGAGVSIVPGATEMQSDDEAAAFAREIGFPVMVKASAGGGGRGLRQVADADDLASALEGARREASASFGDSGIYIEKVVPGARHIEIQILADTHGAAIHLFERECSIQRRHQKVIEEAPGNGITEETAARAPGRRGSLLLAQARSAYKSEQGTCEFLVGADGNFYFLEMNTRDPGGARHHRGRSPAWTS